MFFGEAIWSSCVVVCGDVVVDVESPLTAHVESCWAVVWTTGGELCGYMSMLIVSSYEVRSCPDDGSSGVVSDCCYPPVSVVCWTC